MFKITSDSGFHITFRNGWTVSVQFGIGNYCGKSDVKGQSRSAEIAAWDEKGKWFDFGEDEVKGHVTPDEVLHFMNEISNKDSVK